MNFSNSIEKETCNKDFLVVFLQHFSIVQVGGRNVKGSMDCCAVKIGVRPQSSRIISALRFLILGL